MQGEKSVWELQPYNIHLKDPRWGEFWTISTPVEEKYGVVLV